MFVTVLTQNEAIGAVTASGGGRAPMASVWVRIMMSCINIKRGIYTTPSDLSLSQKSAQYYTVT